MGMKYKIFPSDHLSGVGEDKDAKVKIKHQEWIKKEKS